MDEFKIAEVFAGVLFLVVMWSARKRTLWSIGFGIASGKQ